ncbi:hypothetical protein [Kineococcus glutinatus]
MSTDAERAAAADRLQAGIWRWRGLFWAVAAILAVGLVVRWREAEPWWSVLQVVLIALVGTGLWRARRHLRDRGTRP